MSGAHEQVCPQWQLTKLTQAPSVSSVSASPGHENKKSGLREATQTRRRRELEAPLHGNPGRTIWHLYARTREAAGLQPPAANHTSHDLEAC
jgi:hypothetical protein